MLLSAARSPVMAPGWSQTESPFHVWVVAIQARLGVQSQMDKQALTVVRDYLPQQHQQFYSQLPYLIVAGGCHPGFHFGGNQALSLRQTIVHYESPVNLSW